jgi:DNA polymerase-3 subunit gamma/tau
LKRIVQEVLAAHLGKIAAKEEVAVDDAALTLLAQSAEGSVRDGLSLLDQAIAHHGAKQEPIGEALVRSMLGLADRGQMLSLLSLLLEGKAAEAVQAFRALYESGGDPLLMLQDLLDFTHFITRIKLVPEVAKDIAYAEQERKEAGRLAGVLSMPVLARLWQMLLKAIDEVRVAPVPVAAAEMALVRIAYAADLPTPAEVIREWKQGSAPGGTMPAAGNSPARESASTGSAHAEASTVREVPAAAVSPAPAAPVATRPANSFAEAVELLEESRQPLLAGQLRQFASLLRFAPGEIELHMKIAVARDFTAKLAQALGAATGREWKIMLSDKPGEPALAEQEAAARQQQLQQASGTPLVASVLEQFPGAEVIDVDAQVA